MDGILRDWFDGEQFEEMREWMCSEEYDLSLCLMLNIDWWQPFIRSVSFIDINAQTLVSRWSE